MKFKWLGHASVLITTDSGMKILMDPYEPGPHTPPGGTLFYKNIDETADIVVMSHDHPDHSYMVGIKGNPVIVRGSEMRKTGKPQTEKGITFRVIPVFHDGKNGTVLGVNNMVCFEVEGLKICHTGDIGHTLNKEQMAQLGDVDVLLLCVGLLKPVGKPTFVKNKKGQDEPSWKEYIIDANEASALYEQLSPKAILTIHYGNERCSFKLVNVEEFLKGKKNVERLNSSEVELNKKNLPKEKKIVVLKPAM